MEEINDTILSKLLKLKALADANSQGESDNARHILDIHLKKYGLTLEDLVDKDKSILKEHKIKYSSKDEKNIIYSCLMYMFGTLSEIFKKNVYRYLSGKMEICIKCSDSDWIVLDDFVTFHINNYRKEKEKLLASLLYGYLYNQQLYDKDREINKNEDNNKGKKFDYSILLRAADISKSNMNKYTKKVGKQALRIE